MTSTAHQVAPHSAQESLGRQLAASTAVGLLAQALLLVLALVTTPIVLRHLGLPLYGLFILLGAYVHLFALLDSALNAGLVKHLAAALGPGTLHDANAYLGTTLTLTACAGIALAGGLAAIGRPLIPYLLGLDASLREQFLPAFWLATAAFLIQSLGQPLTGALLAAQRVDLVTHITVATEALRLCGILVALRMGYLLEGVLAASAAATLVEAALKLAVARRVLPSLSFRPRFSMPHGRAIVRFSGSMIIVAASSRVVDSLDKIIIGHLAPVASLGFYSVPYGLSQRLWLVVGSITTVVFPAASRLSGEHSTAQLTDLYFRGSKLAAMLVALPALLLSLLGQEILTLWIGTDFARHAALPLVLLSVAFFVNCLGHVPAVTSQATGRPGTVARFAGLNASLTLALLLVLTPTLGIPGSAAAFLASQAILIPPLIRTANRHMAVANRALCLRSYCPVLTPLCTAAVVCLLLQPLAVSLAWLFLVTGAVALTYAITAFLFTFDARERALCLSFFRQSPAPVSGPRPQPVP